MGKDNKKYKPYDAHRAMAIKWTAQKYKVTPEYVRQCDNYPDMTTSDLANEIRKAMRTKYEELKQLLS